MYCSGRCCFWKNSSAFLWDHRVLADLVILKFVLCCTYCYWGSMWPTVWLDLGWLPTPFQGIAVLHVLSVASLVQQCWHLPQKDLLLNGGAFVFRWVTASSLTPQKRRSWGNSWICILSLSPASARSPSSLQTRYGGEAEPTAESRVSLKLQMVPLRTTALAPACVANAALTWVFNGEVKTRYMLSKEVVRFLCSVLSVNYKLLMEDYCLTPAPTK